MDVPPLLIIFCLFLVSPPCLTHAGPPYLGKAATTACGTTEDSTTALGYSCKGLKTTCQAFVAFRSQSPYNTVSSISSLLNSDPSRVSRINSISDDSSIRETDELVIVPVKCSCSGGQYYQSNTHYFVQQDDTYFSIANNTFQGLSTCQALKAHNSALATTGLSSGDRVVVPLRCACPTKNQTDNGVKYLMSYSVTWNQDVSDLSTIFGADYRSVLEANELLSDPKIYGFPTFLIPLQTPSPKNLNKSHYVPYHLLRNGVWDNRHRHLLSYWPMQSDVLRLPTQQFETLQPTSSRAPAPAPLPRFWPPPAYRWPPAPPRFGPNANNSFNKTWVFVLVGVLGGIGVLLVIGRIAFLVFFRGRDGKES